MPTTVESGPKLLFDLRESQESVNFLRDGIGSVLIHVVLLVLVMVLANLDVARPPAPEQIDTPRIVTKLVDPPTRLTQKEPNKQKVAKEVHLENLLPKAELQARTPTPPIAPKKMFKAPPQNPAPPGPTPAPAVPLPPPKLEAAVTPPQALPPSVLNVPPPQIQPEEKPKLTLETPGQSGTNDQKGGGKVPVPKTSIDDAVRSVARGGGGRGGVMVGDSDQLPSLSDTLKQLPTKGRTSSSLELLSDAMGVDFKPYLIRVLATVRRNWFAVIPESARMGRRGRVVLQFTVDRNGQVPKLVIAMPSGADPLDKAAVAGISASIPLPPLPPEFHGDKVVLQLSFTYNMQ
jgi:TonB family protein